jgi:hypothetical protein
MVESKYAKYILTEPSPYAPPLHFPDNSLTRMIYLDDKLIEGAFNVICSWLQPTKNSLEVLSAPHTHTCNEVIGFFGSNPDDHHDLCGEVEIWMEDEKQILTKSCMLYVPAGMNHNPLIIRRIDRPIFHFSVITDTVYSFNPIEK